MWKLHDVGRAKAQRHLGVKRSGARDWRLLPDPDACPAGWPAEEVRDYEGYWRPTPKFIGNRTVELRRTTPDLQARSIAASSCSPRARFPPIEGRRALSWISSY